MVADSVDDVPTRKGSRSAAGTSMSSSGGWRSFLFPNRREQSGSPARQSANGGRGGGLTVEAEAEPLEEAVRECRVVDDVGNPALAKPLRLIESLLAEPDQAKRKERSDALAALDFASLVLSWWPKFWEVEFTREDVSEPALLPVRIHFVACLKILSFALQVSPAFCSAFAAGGGVREILTTLEKEEALQPDELSRTPLCLFLASGLLSVLANAVAGSEEGRGQAEGQPALETLERLSRINEASLKLGALISLALVVGEDDSHRLTGDETHLRFLLAQLNQFRSVEPMGLESLNASELIVSGLGNLGKVDRISRRLGKMGVVSALGALLKTYREAEDGLELRLLRSSASLFWWLVFEEENRDRVHKRKSVPAQLGALQRHSDPAVATAAAASLWLLDAAAFVPPRGEGKGRSKSVDASSAVSPKKRRHRVGPHAFLVAGQDSLDQAAAIADALAEQDYRTLSGGGGDGAELVGQLRGSLQAAGVVIICLSKDMRDSPLARTQVAAALGLHKPTILLRTVRGYEPDGWLGSSLGNLLFLDAHSKGHLGKISKSLVREVGRYVAKWRKEEAEEVEAAGSEAKAGTEEAESSSSSSHAPPPGSATVPAVRRKSAHTATTFAAATWGEKETKRWLASELKLSSDAVHLFKGFQGKDLCGLRKMYLKAPNAYYKTLNDQMKVPLLDSLRFTDALETLK